MRTRQFFLKLVIILATLSLLLVALAPVVYLLAPQVSVTQVQPVTGEEIPAGDLPLPDAE